ncbi:dienelactone hydrolase family protein [Halomonas sp. SpR8]|uniref:dienelactone hydrolase family protein n=1 Tax=Halomonas sp. SpR8 TaxID=3050463 RepID=UPI0027E4245B|nr:dienelactone hydrolase family protein [Halomonas sp. SpR8]MDQ7729941.1 dienelactone hydrolase family protein [Halomonas sp. SpR8]
MAQILLFHHAQGLTSGIREFANRLRHAGHIVHVPDLYEGRVFDDLDKGVAYAQEIGFDSIIERGIKAAEGLPRELVFSGFSIGVLPAQKLAQTRAGAIGALFFHSCVPYSEFGPAWPNGVRGQIHGMDRDKLFVDEGDLNAAQAIVETTEEVELFLYPGEKHLFADNSLASYDEGAAALLTKRVLGFLNELG